MTLLSIVITLSPTEPTELPDNLGRAAHAWFLDQVMAYDRAYAGQLHEPNLEPSFYRFWSTGDWRPRGGADTSLP